jgi:RNA polymerase sigma-70 factor (ECF subfamily)
MQKGAVLTPTNETERREIFTQLFEMHQREVYFFIRRILLNHDDAADATQNTFLKAWKGLQKFRGESSWRTWLFSIAHNEAMNLLEIRRKSYTSDESQVFHSVISELSNDPLYNGDEIQRRLNAALEILPPKQKAVFVMRYFEGLSYEEMSKITGTSDGALKASYHHAVRKVENYVILPNV